MKIVTDADVIKLAREVARQEVASLCGLVLNRLGVGPNEEPCAIGDVREIFGEALADFSGDTQEPGPR